MSKEGMQPLEGVDLEGHAVACRSPSGVDYHAKEVVSSVAHATPGLVAQCVESAALRYGMSLSVATGLDYSGNRTATHLKWQFRSVELRIFFYPPPCWGDWI